MANKFWIIGETRIGESKVGSWYTNLNPYFRWLIPIIIFFFLGYLWEPFVWISSTLLIGFAVWYIYNVVRKAKK